jgi:hypothetical protein
VVRSHIIRRSAVGLARRSIRDPHKIPEDVLGGCITVDHARDDYGVVLSEVDDGYG